MAEGLLQVSEALAATAERAGPGVVRVEARRRFPATGIAWSPDGIVVTAHHVVVENDATQVGLPTGQTVAATLIGRDPGVDLAILRVGHLVLALGRPRQTVQATLGIVSALGASLRTPCIRDFPGGRWWMQPDALSAGTRRLCCGVAE